MPVRKEPVFGSKFLTSISVVGVMRKVAALTALLLASAWFGAASFSPDTSGSSTLGFVYHAPAAAGLRRNGDMQRQALASSCSSSRVVLGAPLSVTMMASPKKNKGGMGKKDESASG